MAKPPSADSIIRNIKKQQKSFEPKVPIADDMFLPNPSGAPDYLAKRGMAAKKIINVLDPTANQDVATKKYVDDNIVTDHGALTGLTDDDHTQYQKETDFTAGSVLFRGSSVINQDNTNLFWDDANDRLGIKGTSSVALKSNLSAYYKFEESSGNAIDSHNSNDATVTGVAYGATGIISNAFTFDGTTDRVVTPSIGIRSFSLWARPGSVTSGGAFYMLDARSGKANSWVYRTSIGGGEGDLVLVFGSAWTIRVDDVAVNTDEFTMNADTWYHIAGVSSSADSDDIRIGARFNNTEGFEGEMDEIGIWSRALTAGEITTLFNSGAGLTYPFDGTGTIAPICTLDVSGGAVAFNIVSKTGAYTVTVIDHNILCGSGNESFTVTLPSASGVSGIIYNIKNIGTGTITVDGNASETIDGGLTAVLNNQFESISIQCDGSNWHII